MNKKELISDYSERADRAVREEKKEDRILLILSVLRLICFAGGSFLVIFLFLERHTTFALAALPVFTVLFLYLLKLYSDHSDRKQFAANMASININEAAALNGDLAKFDPGERYINHSHDFSFDIDLFGEKSLFRYLNRTVTGFGRDLLADWLSDPFPLASDLAGRQEVVRELAGKIRWRQEFMAEGKSVPLEKHHTDKLLRWLNETPVTGSGSVKKAVLLIVPALTLAAFILTVAGMLHYSLLLLIMILNLAYVSAGLARTNQVHRAVSGSYIYLSSANKLLSLFSKEQFRSVYLQKMSDDIAGSVDSASVAVKKLGNLIQAFDSRLNLLVGFGLNAFLLWDYHCLHRLERWKASYRDSFPGWIAILGKIDAFSSLANYAYNNDAFVYPVLSPNGKVISARDLGHPLINEDRRVTNDFNLERQGSICIITGANMAGKSTFLRTVAVNLITGMTGSPVCASYMEFIPVKLFTSMRTTDSLPDNESYFYAELKRLRNLKSRIHEGEPVIFILDEILKGTNSADKTLGSKLFLNKLVSYSGTGLIATHDISLGELEKDHPGNVINMCFEITIEGESVHFDYKLRRGITRNMNAALLMRQMGILD